MLIPLLLLLSTTQVPAAPAGQPVRVWLEPRAGAGVRVYVRTQADGYLVVLRRRDDGGVEVLVPETPSRASYAAAGTYEVLAADGGGAFTVLAALAPVPFRPGEFARHDAWDDDALAVPSGGGDEPALTEVVQRMLGDESFNYDLATYAGVAPPTVVVVVDSVFVLPAELPVAAYYYGPPFVADFPRVVDFGERHNQRLQRSGRQRVAARPAALAVYQGGQLAVAPIATAAPIRPTPPAPPRGILPPIVYRQGRLAVVPTAAPPIHAAPAAPAAAPRRMLPPIVIVQRRTRASQENPVALMPRTLASGSSSPAPVVRRAVVTSAVAFVPAPLAVVRPGVPQAAPMRASGALPPAPRAFAVPHSGPVVMVPSRWR